MNSRLSARIPFVALAAALLSLAGAAAALPARADGTGVTATTGTWLAPDPAAVVPGPATPFFDELESHFSIIAAGHQLLRNAIDIDRVVGDPWTLKPETVAAFSHMPERFKVNLARFFAGHPDTFFLSSPEPADPGTPQHPNSVPTDLASAQLSGQMSASLQPMLQDTFNGALTPDEMIDLGVYILSKAPFFPKTKEGWDEVKNQIVTYDVYLALAVVVGMAASDQGAAGFSGQLWKSKGDKFRIGWYGSFSHLGRSMQPTLSAGASVASHIADANAGLRYNRNGNDTLTAEGSLTEHWFGSLAQRLGWTSQASVSWHYNIVHRDPNQQGVGAIGGSIYANHHGVAGNTDLDFSLRADGAADTHGNFSSHVTALLESCHSGVTGALDVGVNTAASDVFHVGAVLTGKTDSEVRLARNALRTDGNEINSDLDDLARSKRSLDDVLTGAVTDSPRDPEELGRAELWVGMARLHLKKHLAELAADQAKYESMRVASDTPTAMVTEDMLSPEALKKARAESLEETYEAEKSRMYQDEQ